ncbi:MAG: hypothetical protein R6W68_13675 [Ignavibacteriaceae bacterium]
MIKVISYPDWAMQVTGHLVRSDFIAAILLFIFTCAANAQVYPDQKVDNLLRTGINFIVDQKYDNARKVFNELDSIHSELPLGKIYLAATEIAYSFDFEIPFDSELIESNLENAIIQAEKILERNQNDKWNVYFYALARGYASYYQAINGNWFIALKTGLSSVSAFEECLELDPEFYEAWIAIGTYEYWKSSKTDFISWLPFINDDKKSGIEKLKLAVKSSGYNSHIAIHSLIWIYIDQEEFDSALTLAKYAVEKHPDSRIFKWGLARSFEEKDIQKSIDTYFEILESYKQTGIRTRVNEITLKHIIAQQYSKIRENTKAIKLCEEILANDDLTKFEKNKLEDRLKRVRNLLQKLT